MKEYKIKKNKGYAYLYHYGKRVAGINPKGKMWGVTHYFEDFERLLQAKRRVKKLEN